MKRNDMDFSGGSQLKNQIKNQGKSQVRNRALLILGIMVLLAAAVGASYLLFHRNSEDKTLQYEDNATTGIMPGVDLDERQKELQEVLDKSQIAFSINTTPVFASGSSEGNLLIENPGNNAKLIKVSIEIKDTKEEVYASNYIKPGTYIEKAKLDKILEKGTYEATAYFTAYDEETTAFIGKTGADITLNVEN